MNVSTMRVPPEEAARKLKEYRTGLHRRVDAEYSRAAVAYEAAAAGKPLLILSSVIQRAPRDHVNRPRLAIARADQRQVRYSRGKNSSAESFNIPNAHHRLTDAWLSIALTDPQPQFIPSDPAYTWTCDGFALVPLCPPDVRGTHPLNKRFILWEVEQWADRLISAAPDRDPYLLERVADDLYAVVGEWDLTDIERAVMQDRARTR